jgi:hypothetical protein
MEEFSQSEKRGLFIIASRNFSGGELWLGEKEVGGGSDLKRGRGRTV